MQQQLCDWEQSHGTHTPPPDVAVMQVYLAVSREDSHELPRLLHSHILPNGMELYHWKTVPMALRAVGLIVPKRMGSSLESIEISLEKPVLPYGISDPKVLPGKEGMPSNQISKHAG